MKKKEFRKEEETSDEILRFKKERDRLNKIVFKYGEIVTKRFFSLDRKVYKEGELTKKIKELIGLACSFVLRCDDCIKYHIIKCYEEGINDEELLEALEIGLVVGGSITIPYLRRALEMWDRIRFKNRK
ncbi:MAG: carboxymuconolactone decarboxylase family protein [bacterium]